VRSSVFAVLLYAFIATPVVAADMYVGVNAGSANIDQPGSGSTSSLSLLGGYTFVENVAVEVAYNKFGTDKSSGVTSESKAVSISGIAYLPMNEQFAFFARLGFASTTWEIAGTSVSKGDWTYGIGGIIQTHEKIDIRGSYDIYKVENSLSSYKQKVMNVAVIFNL